MCTNLLRALHSALNRLGRVKATYEPDWLYLDFDDTCPTLSRIWWTLRTIRLRPKVIRYDRTMHGYHVLICINTKLTPWQTLALQAIMGSDWRREALNWFRLHNSPDTELHQRHWNILYERKIYAE